MRRNSVIFTMVAAVSMAFAGCDDESVRTVANPDADGSTPTMVTMDVDTYVSDSGYTKYHAVTRVWEMFEDTDTPYWRFPCPLVIDTYERGMRPNAHVECDSARYLTQRRLFRFDGHVLAVNVQGDTFVTQQLYWDQQKTQFLTDSFIHIVKGDRVLEGYGFVADERMTEYVINNPTAILPASSLKGNREQAENVEPDQQSEGEDGGVMYGGATRRVPRPASERETSPDNPRNLRKGKLTDPGLQQSQGSTAPGLKR